jgi:hypothetical protein
MWFGVVDGNLLKGFSLFHYIVQFWRIFFKTYIEELLEEVVMWDPLYVCLDCGVESLYVDVKKIC